MAHLAQVHRAIAAGCDVRGYLQRLRDICTANNILLIFDEVITGFGRCGTWTGAQAFGVTPDIMNVAKQITNGAQPLGAVLAPRRVCALAPQTIGPKPPARD